MGISADKSEFEMYRKEATTLHNYTGVSLLLHSQLLLREHNTALITVNHKML